jgi:hypothetical protein
MTLINIEAVWEFQSAVNSVPVDPSLVTVPTSGWTSGTSPFGDGPINVSLSPVNSLWAKNTGLWIRRFVVCEGEKDVVVKGNCEQAMFMFWNGTYIGTLNPTNSSRSDTPEYRVIIPKALATTTTHQIALLCLDDTSISSGDTTYISVEADYLPVVFPFEPEAPVTERLSWLTDVSISRDGIEERKRISSDPRQEFVFRYPADVNKKVQALNVVWGDISKEMLVPIWTQAVRVNSIAANLTTLTLDTRYSEFRAPGYVMIWSAFDNYQIVGVYDLTDTTLLISNLTRDFSTCWIMPIRIGVLTKGVNRQFNGLEARFELDFMIRDNKELVVTAPTQYLGEDLYTVETLLSGDSLNEEIKIDLEVFDPGISEFAFGTGLLRARSYREFRVFCEDSVSAWAFRQFLHRRSGRYRSFRQPTFEIDLRPTNTGTITTLLQVRKDEYMRSSQGRNTIAVETSSGWLTRQITDVVSVSETIMGLTLNSAINVTREQIRRISWLGVRRFDSDTIEISHRGAGISEAAIMMVEIES